MLYFAHNEYHWNSELLETKHQMKGRTEWKPTSTNKETSSPTLFVPCELPFLDLCGINWANSAVRANVEGAVAFTVGILFNKLVNHKKFVYKTSSLPTKYYSVPHRPYLLFLSGTFQTNA